MASKSAWWWAMGGVAVTLACPILGCGGAANDGDGAIGGPFDELKFVAFGGYGFSPPEGSTCDLDVGESFTLTSSTRKLSWSSCASPSGTPQQPWETIVLEETISDANFARVESALANVRPNNPKTCGADAGILLLDRVTPTGTDLYVDDFYSGCPWEIHKGRTFVTGLPELRGALAQQFDP